jgi:lipoprotein-anchoring transpeptidase ErfK/SrfK
MERRGVLRVLLSGAAVAATTVLSLTDEAEAARRFRRRRKKLALQEPRQIARKSPRKKLAKVKRKRRSFYKAPEIVDFASNERPGTIIIRTSERALYQVLGGSKARRYSVAVGKEGFSWSGTARVGSKRLDPPWTPPPEMIERAPKFAEWAGGMPGGIPQNPLGAAALYLYKGKRDTQFRIHGTNAPSSIGTAASSGCIRMMNSEVLQLFNSTRNGTKVIVI